MSRRAFARTHTARTRNGLVMIDAPSSRRRMLSLSTMALLSILSGLIVAPVIAFVTSPLRRRPALPGSDASIGDGFADAGPLDAIPTGQWKLIPIEIVRQDGWVKARESRSVWVHRSDANSSDAAAVAVRSPICPHLGCPVMLTPDGTQFCCPCHGGTFNASDGKRVAGPPPRDMDPMEFEIRDGHLWVRWQDFKIGVADRVAVTV